MQLATKRSLIMTLRYSVILIFTAVVLFPIYEMLSTSLKFDVDAFRLPPQWIFVPTFQNYVDVLVGANFLRFFTNSMIVAVVSTSLSVSLGALAAYALARWRFGGRTVSIVGILLLRMIPEVILAVPVFTLFNRLGLTSRLGLIIVYTALNLPFNIWVLRTFIMELPFELEESAIIDGCNDFTVFTRIVLPLVGPGLAVASIFTFRIAWNEFILSLVLTNRFTRTLPVAISMYLTDTGTEWGRITAIATIIAVPAFIFTFTAAKSLIMGLTAGAVKG
ncbi:MAG: carbohydrate ABC transporter permease [Spirochaetaceae bacterium]|nr:MAG: carbohydrate ABC transporter permease [Spirochaetaceae bacterium]